MRDLGPVPAGLREDVDAVAAETMGLASRHVRRVVAAVKELGFIPAHAGVPVHAEPTDDDRREVVRLDREIGGLPAALRACMAVVGEVSLMGDCAPLGLSYNHQECEVPGVYPDPLCLPGVDWLRQEWDQYTNDSGTSDEPLRFLFAPDQYQKANLSGDGQSIVLPSLVADPVIAGVDGRAGIRLVDYVRLTVTWGGFPGWSGVADKIPPALHRLRATPDF